MSLPAGGDICAMGLIGRCGEVDLDRPDQSRIDEGGEQNTIALSNVFKNFFEKRFGGFLGKRRHKADRGAALDAVNEDSGEARQVLAPFSGVQLANFEHYNGGDFSVVAIITNARRPPS